MGLRILAIGAHPDDIETGAAGLLQRATDGFVLVASHGERGGPGDQRRREACAAWSMLGASGRVLGHPDTCIPAPALVPDIERVIREFRPDMILTTSPNDAHQDHAAVSAATLIAARDWCGTILGYCTPSAAEHFRPDWFVSLDAQAMAVKQELVACHASQANRPYLAASYLEAAGRYWAQVTRSSAPFVEPYELLRHRES